MRNLLVLIIVLAAALGCYRLFAQEGSEGGWGGRGSTAAQVVVDTVSMVTLTDRLEAVGTSRALQSAVIFPAIGGEIRKLDFRSGERVKQGDVLVELDAREERLAVELAEVRLENAERIFRRRQDLTKSGTMTGAALDESKGLRDEARIALEQARINLEDRTVRAPFSGFVSATELDVGDRITPTTEITTLDNRDQLLIRFEVPERFIGGLEIGTRITVAPWVGQADPVTAEIVDVGSRVDSVSRTFPARARLENKADTFRPGQSFRIVYALAGEQYPAVPEVALIWGAEGAYVWAVEDGKAVRKSVTIVARRDGAVLVDSVLKEGTTIVVQGVQRVRSGFEIVSTQPALAADSTIKAQQHVPESASQ